MASFIFLGTLTDLGLTISLQNLMPYLTKENDFSIVKKHISTAFVLTCIISLFMMTFSVILFLFFKYDFIEILYKSTDSRNATLVFLFCIFLSIPLNISYAINIGSEEQYKNDYIKTFFLVIGLLAIVFGLKYYPSITFVISVLYGTILMSSLTSFFILFLRKEKKWTPNMFLFDINIAKYLFSKSSIYFTSQLLTLIVFSLDNILIAQKYSITKVGDYTIMMRLVSLVSLPTSVLFSSTYASINEALSSKNHVWLKDFTRKSIAFCFVVSIVGIIILSIWGNKILLLWTGENIYVDTWMLVAMSFLFLYNNLNALLTGYTLSLHYLSMGMKLYVISCVIIIVIKIGLFQYFPISFLPLSTSLIILIITLLPILKKLYNDKLI